MTPFDVDENFYGHLNEIHWHPPQVIDGRKHHFGHGKYSNGGWDAQVTIYCSTCQWSIETISRETTEEWKNHCSFREILKRKINEAS